MNRKKSFQYTLAIACFIAACHVSRQSQETMSTVFDKQGHRGCRGLMPENTIPAMKKAIDLDVTTLEMDAVISKDRQVVVSHDPFFNHDITTLPDGQFIAADKEKDYNIFRMDYAEIRTLDVGMKPHPRFPRQEKLKAYKPLLGELIDSVQQYVKQQKKKLPYFNIETKSSAATDNLFHPGPAEFVDLLMAVINEKEIADHVIIQSFDMRTLQYLHTHYPAIRTALLIENDDKGTLTSQLKELGFVPTIYSPAYELVAPDLVRQCHQLHLRIIPWTIDDKQRIQALKNMGVDGIISDYPDLFN